MIPASTLYRHFKEAVNYDGMPAILMRGIKQAESEPNIGLKPNK